jgi:hypothetical protein
MTFSEFADWVTIVSGSMTFLGLSGLFSWGIFNRDKSVLGATTYRIFAHGVRAGLCLLLSLPFLLLWHGLFQVLVLWVAGSFSYVDYYWQSDEAFQYIFVYFVTVILLLPIYCLICLSIYQWSFSPFVTFYRALSRQPDNEIESLEEKK